MFTERKLLGVPPRPLTANGTSYGLVTVANSAGLFVKQQVIISNNSTSVICEIKRFISDTQFYVGPKGGIDLRQDLSAFTLATSPEISAVEQERQNIRPDDFERAVYVEEPVVAKRVIPVDPRGKYYDDQNPFPVNATVSIGDVKVDLDGFSNADPDSVQITGSIDGTKTGAKFGIVYNRKQQILAAHDRIETYTYADFGTKNQRIVRVDYTSATFPGITVRRDFNYILDGNRYRRTDSPWTVI